jgi:CDP-glucose 4,6-dehydratase
LEGASSLENLGLSPSFWAGKKVFLTGHTGFKGSWLAMWLKNLGVQLTGFSLPPPTQPSLFELAQVSEGMNSVFGDICDRTFLLQTLNQANPDIILHLAAQSLVKEAHHNPLNTFAVNIMGTVNLLEYARNSSKLKAVLVVTSDKAYLPDQDRPHQEGDPLGGHEPYAASKACAEIITHAYRQTYTQNPTRPFIASARAGNVLGGGDWAPNRILPDLVSSFSRGEQVCLRYPEATRPWQHVLEPLWGYLLLTQSLVNKGAEYACAWNFGPDPQSVCTVGEMTEKAARFWGPKAGWSLDKNTHPSEAPYLRLDSTQAKTKLGWQPLLNLDQTLEWSLNWYKAWLAGEPMADFCQTQLHAYQALYNTSVGILS